MLKYAKGKNNEVSKTLGAMTLVCEGLAFSYSCILCSKKGTQVLCFMKEASLLHFSLIFQMHELRHFPTFFVNVKTCLLLINMDEPIFRFKGM